MPTNNKTSLGLNSWVGTDKPRRSDFVEDNTLLDNILKSHFNDTKKHLTEKDRTFLNESIAVGNYCGDGEETQEIQLPFEPKFVLIYLENAAVNFFIPVAEYNLNNTAVASKNGCSSGVFIMGDKLTVCQTQKPQKGGVVDNLNSFTDNYVYIAFK